MILAGASFDPDAIIYRNAVIAAGSSITDSNFSAVNNLIVGLKNQSLWTLIDQLFLLAGTSSIAGALVKAKGSGTATNVNFVNGDYSQTTGLVGNGTSKYINTGRAANTLSNTSQHVFVSGTGFETSGDRPFGGAFTGTAASLFVLDSSVATTSNRSYRSGNFAVGTFPVYSPAGVTSGSVCGTRRSSTDAEIYENGVSKNSNAISVTPSFPAINIFLYALNSSGTPAAYTASRLNMVSIGAGLTTAQALALHNLRTTYLAALT